MERKLGSELSVEIRELAKFIRQKSVKIQSHILLAVHCWAVLHDRPAAWACREENWAGTDDRPARLPSASTVSRWLARVSFGVVLKALNDRLAEVRAPAGTVSVDGKPLRSAAPARTRTPRSAAGPAPSPTATNSMRSGAAALRGRQLLAPRDKAKNPRCGQHYQSPHRLASLRLMTTAAGATADAPRLNGSSAT
jgi:hypothetical protein